MEILVATYNFHVSGEKGIYELAFSVDDDNIESSCSCEYESDRKLCWHRYYILAGKKQRIADGEGEQQQTLIRELSKSSGGRDLLRHAKATFGEKETCRRCNRSEVVDMRQSFSGKFLKVFVPKGRRYFCWSCRWSW